MFADRIKELRANCKLTQREFAKRAGISPTTLISYEKGGKTPSYDVLVKLANEFNVSLDWLCEIEHKEVPRTLADVVLAVVNLFKVMGKSADICMEIIGLRDEAWAIIAEAIGILEASRKSNVPELIDLWIESRIDNLKSIPIDPQ